MQRNPDPDAIGAALGVDWFLKKQYDATCDILYSGVISHPQTRALLNVLNIDLIHINDFDKENYDEFIVVDSTINNTGFDGVPISYVIDHHKEKYAKNTKWINKPVGATCTLVWELIKNNELEIVMTFTSPMCPFGPKILQEVKTKLTAIGYIVNIKLVFNPIWKPSEEVKEMLGFGD